MATLVKQASLADILLRRQLLPPEEIERLLERANGSDRILRAILIEEKLLPDQALAEALADLYGLPYDPLTDFRVDTDSFGAIPQEWMRQHCFVPIEEGDGLLTVAVSDPHDLRALDQPEFLLGRAPRHV